MATRRALTVAKYLIKNYIVNPFLRRLRRALLFFIALIIVGGAIGLAMYLATPSPEEAEEALHMSLRRELHSLGINKRVAIDFLSLALTLALIAAALRGRAYLTVAEEAEYEVLLAQPITMAEYVIGRSLLSFAQTALFSPAYAFMIPAIYDLSGGNLIKALLFPAAVLLSTAFISFATDLVASLKAVLRERERLLKVATYAYLVVGVSHSLAIRYASPLLTAPAKLVAEPVVYCATVIEPWQLVATELTIEALMVTGILSALAGISRRLQPELVKPVSEVLRESAGERRSRAMYSPSPGRALFNQVFLFEFTSPSHLRNVGIGVSVAALCGYLFSHVLNVPRLIPRFAADIAMLLVIAQLVGLIASMILARDLASLWIYRVYALSLAPLAKGLLLKYTLYFSEVLLAFSAFNAVASWEPVSLLYPIVALPISLTASFLLLALLSYIASKRRIVKQAPTGLYFFEELAVAIVYAVVIPLIAMSGVIFRLVLGYATATLLAAAVASSLALACLIFWLASRALAGLIEGLDIVS
ncbi:MAG: hypothetical protein DRK00_05730 [Thermoprotei archaeon]|nr:MAG: hypothetical protein DRK00_05730 [Thermoprotei archaeon]